VPDSQNTSVGRPREVDISKSTTTQWVRRQIRGSLWFYVSLGAGFLPWLLVYWGAEWMSLAPLGLLVLLLVGIFIWLLIRDGTITWMRLARAPAKSMARGNVAEAERFFGKAWERARRFSGQDHRRALMLGELAQYAKNQGRYSQAKALFEESVDILNHGWQSARRRVCWGSGGISS
jgi:hypothetical protein